MAPRISARGLRVASCALMLLGVACGGGSSPGGPAATIDSATKGLEDALLRLADGSIDLALADASVQAAVEGIFDVAASSQEALDAVDEAGAAALPDPMTYEELDARERLLGGTAVSVLPGGIQSLTATGEPPLVVQYINGVGTTRAHFYTTIGELRRRLQEVLPEVLVGGIYQTSALDSEESWFGGRLCPLLEQMFPRYRERVRQVCRLGIILDLIQAADQRYCVDSPDNTLCLFGNVGRVPLLGVGQALEIATNVRLLMGAGARVILVAHSQGNYFVRDALTLLDDPTAEPCNPISRVGVVMLGSPLDIVPMVSRVSAAGQVRRVSNASDPIVRLLGGQWICSDCDPSPVDRPLFHVDHHGMISGYLRGAPLRTLQESVVAINQYLAHAPCELLGTWSGTWTGHSELGDGIDLGNTVGGTWTLELESINLEEETAGGTFHWEGTDALPRPVLDQDGNPIGWSFVPVPVSETRSIAGFVSSVSSNAERVEISLDFQNSGYAACSGAPAGTTVFLVNLELHYDGTVTSTRSNNWQTAICDPAEDPPRWTHSKGSLAGQLQAP